MATYKAQILLGTADAGWSETYYISASTHAAAMANLQNICTARMGLSSADVKVTVLRVSDVTIKGDSFLQAATTPAGTHTGTTCLDPAIAMQVNAYSADHLSWTHLFIRGLPSVIASDVDPLSLILPLETAFNTNLGAYLSAWSANAGLYSKKPGGVLTFKSIATTGFNSPKLLIRRAGRPFGLRRGRRRVA